MSEHTRLSDLAQLYGLSPTSLLEALGRVGIHYASHQRMVGRTERIRVHEALESMGHRRRTGDQEPAVEVKGPVHAKIDLEPLRRAKQDPRIAWDRVREELRGWKDRLDASLADLFAIEVEELRSLPEFQVSDAADQLFGLSCGDVCYYDTPAVPPLYLYWYQVKRVHDVLAVLHDAYVRARRERNQVFRVIDLGSGAGAVTWALALLRSSYRSLGHRPLPFVVEEVDSSPWMVAVADRMWSYLEGRLALAEGFTRSSQVIAWPKADIDEGGVGCFTLLTMGFVFDHGDEVHLNETRDALQRVAQVSSACGIAAITTATKMRAAEDMLPSGPWIDHAVNDRGVWSGLLPELARAGKDLAADLPRGFQRWVRRAPTVDSPSPVAVRMWDPKVPQDRSGSGSGAGLSARTLSLSRDQEEARRAFLFPGSVRDRAVRPVLIMGSAGSGKTVLLVERLMELIGRPAMAFMENESHLVTAFNRDAVDLVWVLLEKRLKDEGINYTISGVENGAWTLEIVDEFRPITRVQGLNFDKVTTRLFSGDLPLQEYRLTSEDTELWLRRAEQVTLPTWCTSALLSEEYRRVIFCLESRTLSAYLDSDRRGRGVPLGRERRRLVWEKLMEVCEQFLHWRGLDPGDFLGDRCSYPSGIGDLFVERRRAAFEGALTPRSGFHGVLVDESQDFMDPDYRILSSCLRADSKARIAVFGDATQGLWFGASSHPKPSPSAIGMRSAVFSERSDKGRNKWTLRGSYRMPAAITSACRPLATRILDRHKEARVGQEDLVPVTRKAGMVGVRPIVVYDLDRDALHSKLDDILKSYSKHLDLGADGKIRRVVLPGDAEMVKALGPDVRAGSVTTIKGQECSMVIWSASKHLPSMTEPLESVYTIVTRAVSVLVIAAGPDVPEASMEALRLLDRKHLLAWDEATSAWMNSW